jgi:hypothetical protein
VHALLACAGVVAILASGTAAAQRGLSPGTAPGNSPDDFVQYRAPGAGPRNLGTLDGTWEGALTVVSATDTTPASFWKVGDRPEFSLAIDGDVASVRVKSGEWRELRIGSGFHVFKIESSAYVYALNRANGWVENWTLSVTKKNPRTMLVFLSYVAGGSLEHLDAVTGEFAVGAMGELSKSDAAGQEE